MKPLAILAVLIVLTMTPLAFGGWSSKNPYRTYNLTGLNYGAQNWERTHGKQSNSSHKSWRFRR